MHLKVFVKLKKTLNTLSPGQKTLKNPKKNQKTYWAGFKKKPGFSNPVINKGKCEDEELK